MRRDVRVITLVMTLAASAACASGGSGTPDASARPSTPRLSPSEPLEPAIVITHPEEGDPLSPGEIIVAVTVRSFDIVDKLGDPPRDGEGHVHYYIDVDDLPTEPGEPAVTDDRRTYHAAARTSHRWQNVTPGVHTFAVQLVNNDHTPLDPPVTDEVEIRVAG